jgi:hypothetical protein
MSKDWIQKQNGKTVPNDNPREMMARAVNQVTVSQIEKEYRTPIAEFEGFDIWCNNRDEICNLYEPNQHPIPEALISILDQPETAKLYVIAHPGLSLDALISGLHGIMQHIREGHRISRNIGKQTRLEMVQRRSEGTEAE